ncbi:hypothetical protein FB45DRAFT_1050692 [Roridomyces roridus]|uniref:DUF4246 domain-containing protein n=1 Tax=Roridomyces roridus TaxID=1738132 RepID=A0AAD7CKI6_9AGAR|nr:hypothetical protein FB45DRAFT_1050692 [Roridomyces roridus]
MPASDVPECSIPPARPHPRFSHPFHEDPGDGSNDELHDWEKMRDTTIRNKWIREAKEQRKDLEHWEQLTDDMLEYVMDELYGYAKLRDEKTGIECGPYEATFVSDSLISQELTEALQRAVEPLEEVPEQEKDWHPGSEGRVLDLVHPSMYPLIYGETYGTFSEGRVSTVDPPVPSDVYEDYDVDDIFISKRFQWLPSDFQVDKTDAVKLASSYINNIHPHHHDELVPVVERLLEHAVPMWDRVLSTLDHCPIRRANLLEDSEDEAEQDRDYGAWLESRLIRGPLTLPEGGPYTGQLERLLEMKFSLAERRIQVIVKLANIGLTPEKPEYPGGTWHVEGMAGESIVSTFIYYYQSENIEACDLSFRMATSAPEFHEEDDDACMRILFDMARNDPCVQDIGSIETKAGRCVAFPNIYQHRVSPFQLVDETKPGVRKILAFFLVDPTVHIPSTSVVGPQQRDVVKYTLLQVAQDGAASSRLAMLPVELLDYIGGLVPGTMSRAEAEEIREELIKERSVMIQSVNTQFFAREFNMCEH